MASYNSTPGKCLIKNHPIHGSIYLNLNKYNKYYIRTKINDISNNYNIPSEYNNNVNLTLKDALNIIESNNIIIKNDTPATAITINNNFKLPETEIKGKFLGKVGNDSLFLNHSKFNNKYYLKLTSLKVERIYPTKLNHNEFWVILKKGIIEDIDPFLLKLI